MEWMKKNKILLEKIGIIAFVYLGMRSFAGCGLFSNG